MALSSSEPTPCRACPGEAARSQMGARFFGGCARDWQYQRSPRVTIAMCRDRINLHPSISMDVRLIHVGHFWPCVLRPCPFPASFSRVHFVGMRRTFSFCSGENCLGKRTLWSTNDAERAFCPIFSATAFFFLRRCDFSARIRTAPFSAAELQKWPTKRKLQRKLYREWTRFSAECFRNFNVFR